MIETATTQLFRRALEHVQRGLLIPADDQSEAFVITNAPPVAEWEAQARALAHAIGESAISCAARFEEGQHDALLAETDARLMESLVRSLLGVLRKLRPLDGVEMVEECLARR